MTTKLRTYYHALPALAALLAVVALAAPATVRAQDRPPERVLRTYVPPDQLVSFLPTTPFDKFVEFLNPIFERVSGKEIIDLEERTTPIGVTVTSMHFLDAFELVLDVNELAYRENERFFIVEEPLPVESLVDVAPNEALGPLSAADMDLRIRNAAAIPGQRIDAGPAMDVTLDLREIQINAVLFEINQSKARELGIDWNVFFGQTQNQQGGGSGGGSFNGGGTGNSDQVQSARFALKTEQFFEDIDGLIQAPDAIDMGQVTQFFRLLETEGLGETVANPQVSVLSGDKGRIQIGSDVPVQTRDFSGNTVTQFFSTGIIIDVTPTLISEATADTVGAPIIDFIHLDVLAEKSSSIPSASGPIINRNTANTKVTLLDGEQTIIGGLYSTEEGQTHRGVPVLKDLPLLKYVFGYHQKTTTQKELLIVLQAKVVDPLEARAQRPFERELLDRRRRQVQQSIGDVSGRLLEETDTPKVEGRPNE